MRPRGAGASLRDVAERAGVSVKTASNVVHDHPHVAATTRARVQRALDELNYRPNLSARNLRRGRSGVIALAVPELDAPYFAELARSVIRAAEDQGWTVLVDQTDGVPERERLVLDGIRAHLIDGLIFSPVASARADVAARSDDTPMVLLGERELDGSTDHVAIDNVAAARAATDHLLGLGRRRVAAVGDQRAASAATARLRHAGYAAALTAAGRDVDPCLVEAVPHYRRGDGAAAMARLLELPEPPDAVFCFNDLLALGAVRALHERGVRVPEDVAVVGFDDIEESRYSIPTLTTVRPDKDAIAARSVDLLAARLRGERTDRAEEILVPYELVVRESTAGRSAADHCT